MSEKIHKFNRYTVTEKEIGGGWIWLSIKYTAKKATPSWRELQTIKNNIVGENRQAIEIYPSEDSIVDTLNHYHLWVMPKGQKFQLGYKNCLNGKEDEGLTRQRIWSKGEEKSDALSDEEIKVLKSMGR